MLDTLSHREVVKQLCSIYLDEESWHGNKLSEEGAIEYFSRMLQRGNIITYIEGNKVVGYIEFWCITYEQLGRLICHEPFYTDKEDTVHGNISYVANTWIHTEWRNSYVYKTLRDNFFLNCFRCDYFVGSALRKKTQPIKVFKRDKLMSSLFKQGEK